MVSPPASAGTAAEAAATGAILTEKMDEKKRKLVSDSEKFFPRLFFVLLVFS